MREAIEVICREWATHGDQCFDWDDSTDSPEEREPMREDARRHLAKILAALDRPALSPAGDGLREFARRVLNHQNLGDVDGGDIQDWGLELGLLVKVRVSKPCDENCNCEDFDEFPQDCVRLAPALSSSSPSQETAG